MDENVRVCQATAAGVAEMLLPYREGKRDPNIKRKSRKLYFIILSRIQIEGLVDVVSIYPRKITVFEGQISYLNGSYKYLRL